MRRETLLFLADHLHYFLSTAALLAIAFLDSDYAHWNVGALLYVVLNLVVGKLCGWRVFDSIASLFGGEWSDRRS